MNINPVLVSKEELFARKESHRFELAALPIEEKIRVLIKLQHMASKVKSQTGRGYRKPWDTQTTSIK
jgi:hypothetical protein